MDDNAVEPAVLRAVREADWLQSSDQALVTLATIYARRLDTADADYYDGMLDTEDWLKTGYVLPHLDSTMTALGFSPDVRAELKQVKKTPGSQPCDTEIGSLVDDFERSVEAMKWRTIYDIPKINAARKIAQQITIGTKQFYDGEITSTVYNKALYQGPNFLKSLTALGGTPAGRAAVIGDSKNKESDPIDELKKRRLANQRKQREKEQLKKRA